jgi:hypothetical protein
MTSASNNNDKEGLWPLPTTDDRITAIVRGNSILNLISGLQKGVEFIESYLFDDDDQKVLDGVNDAIAFLTELMRANDTSTHEDMSKHNHDGERT